MPRSNERVKHVEHIDSAIPHATAPGIWMIDFLKALASQLIVWHHFVSYGPLIRTLRPYAPSLVDWLFVDARMAVQAFLVIGGFLAARSLAPHIDAPMPVGGGRRLVTLVGRRYLRLGKPYFIALGLGILCAALARSVLVDADTPAAPGLQQVLFHLLLIHDITHTEALTTGAWYVAADLQLYALLLAMLWLAQQLATGLKVNLLAIRSGIVLGLAALSLFWANRNTAMEVWALYFFAAYALVIMTHWAASARSGVLPLAALLLLYVLALAVDFRERLLVSLCVAALLFWGERSAFCPSLPLRTLIAWLSRISYWVFLIHYPLVLLVGVLVERLWPAAPLPAALGLLAAWAVTLLMAQALHTRIEAKAGRSAAATPA